MHRRQFLGAAAFSGSLSEITASAAHGQVQPPNARPAKRRRTMYFNDARHFYLYSFEPPMTMEDAWRPIDELAGTAVDTFIYGVETGGALFSDTKVGTRFGTDRHPLTSPHDWRAYYNLQSLIDQGLDPLQVLIDRAHQRGLDFITSLRMGGGPREDRYRIGVPGLTGGGRGPQENCQDFGRREVRDVRFDWLEELASYPVEGIELDFAFTPFYFKPNEIKSNTSLMTDYVRRISNMIRSKGNDRIVGARVFPSLEMNVERGLDVATWFSQGLVDYVAPLFYGYFMLDADMPFESMARVAHAADGQIYGMLQPYFLKHEEHATPAMVRAAAANYWAKGADGLIVAPWFYWPFRDAEKSILTDLGAPEDVREKNKHYVLSRRQEDAAALGYNHRLPLSLPKANADATREIPFYVADDMASKRVGRVRLLLRVNDLITDDRLEVKLNGVSLDGELMRRTSHRYEFQWLDYELVSVRPRRGRNVLAVSLQSRPNGLHGGVTVDQLEFLIEYGQPQSAYSRPDLI
jgi:hypothetical protein